ncbi:MAG: lipoxygenase family protein [Myxococcota bacterium]
MTSPVLPQHDPNPEQRRQQVAQQDASNPVVYDRFTGLAFAPSVPPSDRPAAAWLATVAEVLVRVGLNAAEVDRRLSSLHPEHPEHHAVLELLHDAEKGGAHAAFDFLVGLVQGQDDDVPASSLADYEALFRRLPVPACATEVHDDLWFARMRVAGPNPMSLQRVDAAPFALTEAAFARSMGTFAARGVDVSGATLASAAAEGRLFVADYSGLRGVEGGTWGGRQKYLFGPVALFASVGAARTLVPVAIRADDDPVGPADGLAWQRAKTVTTVADGNVHQAVIHLAHTHLVLEAVVLAARRSLAPTHPVARLLAPHFEGTLYINDAADQKLAAPGGGVDAVMGGPITFSRAAAVSGAQTWSFRGSMLPRELRARGVDDPETLREYPYRDDALLVHAAIHRWVEAYLRTWYGSDGDVAGDVEVRAMFGWLGAPDGGRLRDVPVPVTVADLVDAVAHVVFTASAQHAAVNFPQLTIMSYAPAFPLAGYRAGALGTEADWFSLLPPLPQAHFQATLGLLLGSVHHTSLGGYPHHLFGLGGNFAGDPRIDPALASFQADLRAVEAVIDQRNRGRAPYPFLLPSRIPQSINI